MTETKEMLAMNSLKLTTVTLVLVGSFFSGVSQAADSLSWNVATSARYDDNLGLAPDAESERDDVTLTVSGGLTWTPVQSTTDTTAVGLSAFYDGVMDLEDLSNYGMRVDLSHRHQFGESFTAPWVRLSVAGILREYEDSEPRDGYSGEAELAIGRNFGPRVEVSIGARHQTRKSTDDNPEGTLAGANSDEVFDQDRSGGFVRMDISPAPKTAIFVEYSYLTGDVAVTSDILQFGNGLQFDRVRDFAYEEGARYLAYKIDADQNVYSIGLNQDISTRFSFNIGASYMDADAELGNEYENIIVTAGLSLSF